MLSGMNSSEFTDPICPSAIGVVLQGVRPFFVNRVRCNIFGLTFTQHSLI